VKQLKFKLFFLLLIPILSIWSISLHAQEVPEPMNPPRLVNDFAGIFSEEQRHDLETVLRAYNDSTSTQIYVVTMSDLQGYPASDFAFKLGEQWKIGQKGKNNGAVVLIKPKVKNSRGDLYIATGYGLEEKLTDARCGRIMDQYMIPFFRQGDYYSGTKSGVEVMMKYLSGQFKADKKEDKTGSGGIIVFIFLVVILVILFSNIGKNGPNNGNGGQGGGGMFIPPFFGGGRGRSGDDDFGGFGSGGGFGGGGGGSFGGGGGGRSW
jgi:uncharacterized protein